ncbi:MAG: hypothetical protein ACR2GO_03310 [Candidatus Limnocylindria bacterium]
MLERIDSEPRDQPLRLSLARVTSILPSEVVNLCLTLELAKEMGFPSITIEPPPPSFMEVFFWMFGFWKLFPEYAPPQPTQNVTAQPNDRRIELHRFSDLAGARALRDRLPGVLTAAPGAADVPGGEQTLRRLAGTVYELAENTLAHSRRLHPDRPIIGYYMVQRLPNRRRTSIAVGDIGDGIPATMRVRYPDLTDDIGAIQAAFEPGVSGDDGGGNGLSVAHEAACTMPGGVMTIESGAARVRVRRNGINEQHLYTASWPATRISFMFNL